ncbi:MAG: hypothetical protein AAF340_17965 [Pseudomonadota bacterium]
MNPFKSRGPKELFTRELCATHYYHRPKSDVSLEDVLTSNYWHHIRHSLKPGSRIEVFAENCEYWADILVTSWSSQGVTVVPLASKELVAEQFPESPYFTVKVKEGNAGVWGVFNTHTGFYEPEAFPTQIAAAEWLAANRRKLHEDLKESHGHELMKAG